MQSTRFLPFGPIIVVPNALVGSHWRLIGLEDFLRCLIFLSAKIELWWRLPSFIEKLRALPSSSGRGRTGRIMAGALIDKAAVVAILDIGLSESDFCGVNGGVRDDEVEVTLRFWGLSLRGEWSIRGGFSLIICPGLMLGLADSCRKSNGCMVCSRPRGEVVPGLVDPTVITGGLRSREVGGENPGNPGLSRRAPGGTKGSRFPNKWRGSNGRMNPCIVKLLRSMNFLISDSFRLVCFANISWQSRVSWSMISCAIDFVSPNRRNCWIMTCSSSRLATVHLSSTLPPFCSWR